MRILNTVYVADHRAKVTVRHQSIEIREGRRLAARFPMESTDAIVLLGAAGVTSEALTRCTRRGIRVASLNKSGRLRFSVGGPVNGNVLLRVAQLRAADDLEVQMAFARAFVAGKLQNQRRVLSRWSERTTGSTRLTMDAQRAGIESRLAALGSAPTADHIRGLEGDATRRYFKALGAHLAESGCGLTFMSRRRRPPRDPVNALLGYLYGLLVVEATGALEAVGLDPQVGFLHGLRPGRPSLALDLVEEFRPALAERFAVAALTRRQIRLEHFTEAGGAWYLGDEGRRQVIERWEEFRSGEVVHMLSGRSVPRSMLMTMQATLLARVLRGDLPAYPPFVVPR